MLLALEIFFKTKVEVNRFLIVALLILSTVLEGIGLAAVLPVLVMAGGEVTEKSPEFAQRFMSLLESYNLQPNFTQIFAFMVICLISKEFVTFAALRRAGYVFARMMSRTRLLLVDSFFDAQWNYYSQQPLGKFAAAITNFANVTTECFVSAAKLLATVFRTSIYLVVAFLVSPKIASLALVFGIIGYFSMRFVIHMIREINKRKAAVIGKMNISLVNLFTNIKPLKAMSRQKYARQELEGQVNRLEEIFKEGVVANEGFIRLQRLYEIVVLVMVFVLSIMIWKMPLVELVVAGGLMLGAMKNIGRIQNGIKMVVEKEPFYRMFFDLIEKTDAAKEIDLGSEIPKIEEKIAFDNVDFSFDEKPILKSCNVTIPAKKLIVIKGLSGAGKTTIVDLILGLYLPINGDIKIDGVSTRDVNLHEWRKTIGYVAQDLILLNGTVRENVCLKAPGISDEAIWEALEAAECGRFRPGALKPFRHQHW